MTVLIQNIHQFFKKHSLLLMLTVVIGSGLLLAGMVFPGISSAYTLRDEQRGNDLLILGLGMVRLNSAWVDGNAPAFERSDDGFAEGFDTREFLSLTANGTLFHEYGFDGFIRYDEEDEPMAHFLATLSRDESFLSFGDQTDIFQDTYYTRYASPFRGLTLHLEREGYGVTTFGAVTRGSSEKETLTPDGKSGPYRLASIPVVPGSEIITFEIRKRNDPNQVIEKIPKERNVDYTIDYDTGEIFFADPVDPETFRGDLVYIVVMYRSEEESSAFNTSTGGARAFASPTEWLTVGAGYISEFDREPGFSDGFDRRQEVYSVDGAFRLGEALRMKTEYALSHDRQNLDNDDRHAFLAEIDGNIGERFELFSRYHRNERDFLTFANPDIETDEQEFEAVGRYALLPNHTLEVGYSFLEDNLPPDDAEPTTTTHRPYVGWDGIVGEHTTLFSSYEYIRRLDDRNPSETDDYSHIVLFGGTHDFLNVPALKKIALRGEYQRADFEDDTDQEADTITHQIAGRILTEPWRDSNVYFEQKERLIHDKNLDDNTERQDISELGLELGYWQRLSLKSKYQYRTDHDLLQDRKTATRHTVNLSADYQPFDLLKAYGRFEMRDETYLDDASPGIEDGGDFGEIIRDDERSSQGLSIEGRLLYSPLKDLTAQARYKFDQDRDQGEAQAKTMEDETEFRINYAFDQRRTRVTASVLLERDLVEAPPTPETETQTTTFFLGAIRQLTDRWDILAQYKHETVDIDADNFRDDVLGEIGYELGRFIKISGGYQYTNFENHEDTDADYIAHSIYIKLIGKL